MKQISYNPWRWGGIPFVVTATLASCRKWLPEAIGMNNYEDFLSGTRVDFWSSNDPLYSALLFLVLMLPIVSFAPKWDRKHLLINWGDIFLPILIMDLGEATEEEIKERVPDNLKDNLIYFVRKEQVLRTKSGIIEMLEAAENRYWCKATNEVNRLPILYRWKGDPLTGNYNDSQETYESNCWDALAKENQEFMLLLRTGAKPGEYERIVYGSV